MVVGSKIFLIRIEFRQKLIFEFSEDASLLILKILEDLWKYECRTNETKKHLFCIRIEIPFFRGGCGEICGECIIPIATVQNSNDNQEMATKMLIIKRICSPMVIHSSLGPNSFQALWFPICTCM